MKCRRSLIALALIALGCSGGAQPMAMQGKQATFDVRHELKVIVPPGAKKVRVWFTMPQDDPAQKIANFKVEAPFPNRIEKDSEGNKVVFLEATDPAMKEF